MLKNYEESYERKKESAVISTSAAELLLLHLGDVEMLPNPLQPESRPKRTQLLRARHLLRVSVVEDVMSSGHGAACMTLLDMTGPKDDCTASSPGHPVLFRNARCPFC